MNWIIHRHACSNCNLAFPVGSTGYPYAVDAAGLRVACLPAREYRTVFKVTGMAHVDAQRAGRTGYADHCICDRCLTQFDLDLAHDPRQCPACHAVDVRTLSELIDRPCPRCSVGKIEQGSPLSWDLDHEWEHLPVPQIVKDLTHFLRERNLPDSLRPAAAATLTVAGGDKHNFFVVALRLWDWWQSNCFSANRLQRDSMDLRPEWTWCKVLPGVLQATPELADLIVIRNGCCWFAEGVSLERRRGIKNYARRHYQPQLFSSPR